MKENQNIKENAHQGYDKLDGQIPSTKKYKRIINIIKLLLPIIMGLIAVFEYVYLPNHRPTAKQTNFYNGFLWILIGIYTLSLLISIKNKKLREHKSSLFL